MGRTGGRAFDTVVALDDRAGVLVRVATGAGVATFLLAVVLLAVAGT